MEHLNPRGARVVALEKPTAESAASGTSSATSSTFPPRAKSSCSTAPGTTAPASSTSWASAPQAVRRVHPPGPGVRAEAGPRRHPPDQVLVLRRREEQRRRFAERQVHPVKQWKLSPRTSPPSTNGTTTPRPRRTCSSNRHRDAPGPSSSATARSAPASTPCATSCVNSTTPTRTLRRSVGRTP